MKNVVGVLCIRNLHLALSRLQEDGEEALVAVARSVAKGEPLVRCQLLASIFYEELRRQLRQCPRMDNPERAILVTAADYCGRAAITRTTPTDLLRELRNAVSALSGRPALTTGQRPVLRVIEGGLSRP
jgi:hypothetical protein